MCRLAYWVKRIISYHPYNLLLLPGSVKTWRAVTDYDPEGAPDHLKVQEGELLLERTPEEDGLTRVQNKQGEHGLVPFITLEGNTHRGKLYQGLTFACIALLLDILDIVKDLIDSSSKLT